jgi:hypothetical protein
LALLLVRFAVDVFSFGKPGLGAFWPRLGRSTISYYLFCYIFYSICLFYVANDERVHLVAHDFILLMPRLLAVNLAASFWLSLFVSWPVLRSVYAEFMSQLLESLHVLMVHSVDILSKLGGLLDHLKQGTGVTVLNVLFIFVDSDSKASCLS